MTLILQVALGIVIGIVLLSVLPAAIQGVYAVLKEMLFVAPRMVMLLGGLIAFIATIAVLISFLNEHIPKNILVIFCLISWISMVAFAVIMSKLGMPAKKQNWVLTFAVLGGISLCAYADWAEYSKYGVWGDDLADVAPIVAILALVMVAQILQYKYMESLRNAPAALER